MPPIPSPPYASQQGMARVPTVPIPVVPRRCSPSSQPTPPVPEPPGPQPVIYFHQLPGHFFFFLRWDQA